MPHGSAEARHRSAEACHAAQLLAVDALGALVERLVRRVGGAQPPLERARQKVLDGEGRAHEQRAQPRAEGRATLCAHRSCRLNFFFSAFIFFTKFLLRQKFWMQILK